MRYKINLLPEKKTTLLDKVMYFSLNYLRYIIVITQLVVIGVFFYRFQIDQRIIDLKESVDQKKEIVEIVLPLLQEASRIDKKSLEIDRIIKKQEKFDSMVKYLLSVFPETVTLTNLESLEDSLKITGNAVDAKQLQAFFALLKREGKFAGIEFKSIKKTENGYNFIMTLDNYKSS
ncbi:PilN domain-containing protein [Candidatus Roizmanbacteria bacterium]|nr:PilN domain-containing protein [Candidatus Roizmanbacteria bacterium]